MHIQHLPNGVAFVSDRMHSTKICALGFRFAVGSSHERKELGGITHFVEHMLFKGTPTRSAFDISAAFDRFGGYLNAYTDRESVFLFCVVPGIHALAAAAVICDMVENASFDAAEIEKERDVILSEIAAAKEDPEEAALDAVAAVMFPGDGLAQSIAGTEESVASLTRDQLHVWYREHFATGELAVYAAGNTDFAALEQRLSGCGGRVTGDGLRVTGDGLRDTGNALPPPRTPYPVTCNPSPSPSWSPGLHFVTAPFQQTQVFALTPLPMPVTEERYYAWAILNTLIGDSMSSRLFQRLREQTGYCYNVESYACFFDRCAFWCAYASVEKKNVTKVVGELLDCIRTLARDGPTSAEITAAEDRLCGGELLFAEDVEGRMKHLVRLHRSAFSVIGSDAVCAHFRTFGPERLTVPLAEMLCQDRAALVVYGPNLAKAVRNKIEEMWSKYR